jgi:hypothetical protein
MNMKKWKNITKRIVALGLAAVLIANSVPVTALADSDIMSFANLQARLKNAQDGETITLSRDYMSETTLVVPSGKNVTLDLNDHYILYKGTGSAPVITVNGSLTLKDSKTTGRTTRYILLTNGRATDVPYSATCNEVTGGFIAGGNNESNRGGGVYVEDSGKFTMEGGTIAGCKAAYGGGVYVEDSGKFTMEGGTIAGCQALYDGGGVFINNSGNFNMKGGGITNCTATGKSESRGGGVNVNNSGKFTMEGGSITDCTSNIGGGVYVFGGTFNVSGKPVIRDNKKGSDANNVALDNSKYITYITVTGALTTGAEIRVSGDNGKVIAKPGTGYTITADDVAKFHSDDTSLSPGLYGGNVVLKETLPTATLSNTSMEYNGSAFSPMISFEGATLTKDNDYTLSYKKVVDTQETSLSGAPKDAGSYKLVVAGKGSYTGKQELDFTITKKSVTVVSGITVKDKEYDGGTTAELITTGAVFEGKCDGDTLTVSATGAGTFADKDAGASKAVNIDATKFVLGGASAGNYVLAENGHQDSATATISKKSITVTGVTARDKEYDGNTIATTVISAATVTGLVGTDTVEFTVDGTFADANKGTNKTVTLSNWNLKSGDNNYVIDAANSQTITTASITGGSGSGEYTPATSPAPSAEPGSSPEPTIVEQKTETTNNPDGTTTTTTTILDSEGTKTTEAETILTDGSVKKVTSIEKVDGKTVTEQVKQPSGDFSKTTTTTKVKKDDNGNVISKSVSIQVEVKTGKTTTKTSFSVISSNKKVVLTKATTTAKSKTVTIPKTVKADGVTYSVVTLKKGMLKGNKKKPTKVKLQATGVTKVEKGAFKAMAKNGTIYVSGTKKQFKKLKKLIEKSGLPKGVKVKRA